MRGFSYNTRLQVDDPLVVTETNPDVSEDDDKNHGDMQSLQSSLFVPPFLYQATTEHCIYSIELVYGCTGSTYT